MMLGVWFVFSKHYSDKLSEDSKRGSESKHLAGKTLGYKRYGYRTTVDGYWAPDPETFETVQHAFEMKLDGKTDEQIANWLRVSGVKKVVKKT